MTEGAQHGARGAASSREIRIGVQPTSATGTDIGTLPYARERDSFGGSRREREGASER